MKKKILCMFYALAGLSVVFSQQLETDCFTDSVFVHQQRIKGGYTIRGRLKASSFAQRVNTTIPELKFALESSWSESRVSLCVYVGSRLMECGAVDIAYGTNYLTYRPSINLIPGATYEIRGLGKILRFTFKPREEDVGGIFVKILPKDTVFNALGGIDSLRFEGFALQTGPFGIGEERRWILTDSFGKVLNEQAEYSSTYGDSSIYSLPINNENQKLTLIIPDRRGKLFESSIEVKNE